MRLFLIFIFSLFCGIPPLSAQVNGIEQASDLVTVGSDKFLRWYGHAGRIYFIQVSDPNDHLKKWTWAPIIESGNDQYISYEVDGTSEKGFFRLKYTDQPTTDPDNDDFDGDSISNLDEISYYNSDPLDADTDNDGMPDGYEAAYYFDLNFDDGGYDYDGDGLTNLGEYTAATEPYYFDTDGDGMNDGFEVTYLLNPLVAGDAVSDADSDGLSNLWEYRLGLNPRLVDSNVNGINDDLEDRERDGLGNLAELITHNTDPSQPDSDLDTLPDGWEVANGFDPTIHNGTDADPTNDETADPDGDGLTNSQEADHNTKAKDPDTDGDGVNDDIEIGQGSNPNDPNDSQPPPSGTTPVNITFGDDSGSHSEKYQLKLTPLEGDNTGHTERLRTNRNYGEPQTDTFHLPKGAKYKVELLHIATKPSFRAEHGFSNYDWTLDIDDIGSCLVVDDPDTIVTTVVDWPNSTFLAEGKSATLYVPLFEWITPKASPVSAPDDAGDGRNEFTYNAASPGVLTMDLKVLVKPTGTAALTDRHGVKFSDRCIFELPTISGATFSWDAANTDGKATTLGENLIAKAIYTSLPVANTDFGLKQAEFACDGNSDALPKADFEIFFLKDAINHPAGVLTGQPNWFFYWKEGAVCGIPSDAIFDPAADYGYVRPSVDRFLRLGPIAAGLNNGPETFNSLNTYGSLTVTGDGKGIKCVAETAQHELHHITIYDDAAGKSDGDTDGVADASEPTLDGVASNPSDGDTYRMRVAYGATYSTYGDNEIRCRKIELNLTIQYYPKLDWANPGCQSKIQFGPQP